MAFSHVCALALVTLFLVCAFQPPNAAADSFAKRGKQARVKCPKESGVTEEEMKNWKEKKTPIGTNGTCCEICACFMRELGFMKDGVLNLQSMKDANEERYDNLVIAEMANSIDEQCVKNVTTTGKKECEIAQEFQTCKINKRSQLGASAPPQSY